MVLNSWRNTCFCLSRISIKVVHYYSWLLHFYFRFIYLILCIWLLCLHVHMCAKCMPSVHGSPKMLRDPLELESHEQPCGCWVLNRAVSTLCCYAFPRAFPSNFFSTLSLHFKLLSLSTLATHTAFYYPVDSTF